MRSKDNLSNCLLRRITDQVRNNVQRCFKESNDVLFEKFLYTSYVEKLIYICICLEGRMGERKTEMIEIEVHEKLNRFNFRPTFPIFGQLCQFRDVSTFYNSGLKPNLWEREKERESSFVLSVTMFRFYLSSEIFIRYCRTFY